MAEISPLRAFRYDLGRVGQLADVIAPPYDVIDAALRAKLAARHPNNIVHVDMPEGDDAYARAGRLWKDWTRSGVLQQDSARGLYVYEQEFTFEEITHRRRGFFARVHLEPASAGVILPHEETFAGPKADRLRLMEATEANLSPVFGLFDDPDRLVQQALDAAISRMPPVEAEDMGGVIGRIWPVTDQSVIAKVAGLMGPKTILIADGHHRYETSLTYRDQVTNAESPADAPARSTLMVFVAMSDPGLLVLPTHRLISNATGWDAARLTSALEPHFTLRTEPTIASAWDQVILSAGQGSLAFGFASGPWIVAQPCSPQSMLELCSDRSADWRGLSVSVLHQLALRRAIPEAADWKFGYVHRLDEVSDALAVKQCEIGVLVHPASVQEVAKIAAHGERMPQKSTYFYPKLQTGFVFNPLNSN